MGRPRSCVCDACPKCRAAGRARRRYQSMTMEERRAWVARRDRDKARASDRARYYRDPEGRKARMKDWATRNPERRDFHVRGWRLRNPEKRAAHNAVSAAIQRGALTKGACEECGATDLVHAHHDDYSRPLDVRWLCPQHHADHHAIERTT